MALPKYDKSKRKSTFQQLPKGAYVIKLLAVKQEANKNSEGEHLRFMFDIAEGEFKNFYETQYQARFDEDKKWPADACYMLNIPGQNSPEYVWRNYNTFFADLEDSNPGFMFDGDNLNYLKNKVIGGKFRIEQSEWKGNVYDHTRLGWTCPADDVRSGRCGRLPNDKLISRTPKKPIETDAQGFMTVPEADDEEIPF